MVVMAMFVVAVLAMVDVEAAAVITAHNRTVLAVIK
jgi:hypothetical protein